LKKQSQIYFPFTPKSEELERLEIVKFMFEHYKKLHQGFPIIGGDYVAFLEGLTNNFSDISIFIVLKDGISFTEVLEGCSYTTQYLMNSPYILCGTTLSIEPCFKLENIVYIPSLNQRLIFNFIPIRNSQILCWEEAVECVLANIDLPICAVALTPNFNNFVRFTQASLKHSKKTLHNQLTSSEKREKYRKRVINFGQVCSLQRLVINFIENGNFKRRC